MQKKEPKYLTIIQALETELNSSKFKKNDPFYSENDIKKKYHVSSTTAVRVLNQLAGKKYITRIQGKGTFVSKFNLSTSVRITDTHPYDITQETVKILNAHLTDQIPSNYGKSLKDHVWSIERIREVEEPFQYSKSWFDKSLLSEEIIKNSIHINSIYELIREHSQIDMYKQQFVQNYIVTTAPTKQISKLLNISSTDLLIHEERWVKKDNEVLEYTDSYQLPKYFGLHIVSDNA